MLEHYLKSFIYHTYWLEYGVSLMSVGVRYLVYDREQKSLCRPYLPECMITLL